MRKNHLQRLILSMAVSMLALGLVFGLLADSHPDVSPAMLARALRHALPVFVALYFLAQLAQGAFRAWRASVLIRSGSADGQAPGVRHVFWVTLARNMFVDMLPARLGELSYVGMLNRGYRIGADVCLSSLSVGLVFDFLALLVVLAVAIPAAAQGASLVGSLILLGVVCLVGYGGLFHLLPWGVGWARRSWPGRWTGWRPFAAMLRLAETTADSVVRVRRAGILPSVLLLSAGIRFFKYAGMYGLFLAVTRPLWPELAAASPWAVLVALIAAEGAASLPVPTFMSFGTYEAGGLAALCALGFGAGESVMAMFSLHVLSQLVDYGLGIVGYGIFSWNAPGSAAGSAALSRRRTLLRTALTCAFLLAGLLFAAGRFRKLRNMGALTPPPAGLEVRLGVGGQATVAAVLDEFRGRIVWSSNRGGQHDLWMLTYPGGHLRRLTEHPHTETYPRISPSGDRVVFCRSRDPWVSQRNPVPWDVHLLDLATSEVRIVSTNAFTPAWTPDGSGIVYVSNGTRIHRQRLEPSPAGTLPSELGTGTPEVLAAAGRAPFPEGIVFQTPDAGPGGRLALTLRGRRRGTVLLESDGGLHAIGGGCQLGWFPGGDALLYVDDGGHRKNAIYRYDLAQTRRSTFFDAPGDYSHEYFPRVSRDGQWLVYAAAAEGHEHDTADYEIFLWKVGSPMASAARLTAHTGNDCWPDLHVDE